MDIFDINNSVLMIILFCNLDEKAMVAMSVLPAILDTRAKKSDYKLVHVIKVSMIFVKLIQGAFPMYCIWILALLVKYTLIGSSLHPQQSLYQFYTTNNNLITANC